MRRLSEHPAIIVWDAGNEVGGFGNYAAFVMRTVAEEDKSRSVWPSCPSNGWLRGVQRLNSRPLASAPDPATGRPTAATLVASGGQYPRNDSRVCTACQCGLHGCSTAEHHGPYAGGSGWFTNEKGAPNLPYHDSPVWRPLVRTDPNLPAGANKTLAECPLWNRSIEPVAQCRFARGGVGPSHQGSFTSEFGAVAMPSFESLAASLLPQHYSLHSPPMAERNWPADGAVASYFGDRARLHLNDSGVRALQRSCYQSQLAQALNIKSQVELLRSSNSWGALTWQLNDVYPSGSWGSLEYGSRGQAGQVVGGRWRMLHHLFATQIFVDVLAACGADGYCFVRNDALAPFRGEVEARVLDFGSGARTTLGSLGVALAAGAGAMRRFCLGDVAGAPAPATADCDALRSVLATAGLGACFDSTGRVSCALEMTAARDGGAAGDGTLNLLLLGSPQMQLLPRADVVATVEMAGAAIVVTVESSAVALFVTLSTTAQGRFSDNAFTLTGGDPRKLRFLPFDGAGGAALVEEIRRTLRIEHLALNLVE